MPPPAVTDNNANETLNDAYQGGHDDPHIHVGRSCKRRKVAETLYACNRITEQELGEQEVFHLEQATSALSAGAVVPRAPAWFGPAMNAALAPITQRLDSIEERLDSIEERLHNIEARQANATAQAATDTLQPIRDGHGSVSPIFPATLRQLNLLTNAQRSLLLQFYGRNANPVGTREQRLKQLIGLRY